MNGTDLATAARTLRAARQRMDAAKQNARRAAILASQNGITESEIARSLEVNRLTVRRWLGK